MDDKEYWKNYYKHHFEPIKQSSFADFVLPYLKENKSLIELGCGNGRDSIYFSKGCDLFVLGIDQADNEIDYLNTKYGCNNLKFSADDFTNLNSSETFDFIYSRFTFHSINEKKEDNTLEWVVSHLNDSGLFFLEARSINDSMYQKGEKLSENENFTDHYRRYMDLEKIKTKLIDKGLSLIYTTESDGLAICKNDNPVVIRIIARKVSKNYH